MSVSEKLYPPTIPSSIPAFYEDDGTVIITVPFIMNKAVSANEITDFVLKVKSIQTNSQLVSLYVYEPDVEQIIANGYVQFSCSNSSPWLMQGPYFKFQLAYKHNDVTGYFSSVATGKKTVKPTISLEYPLTIGIYQAAQYNEKQIGIYETTDLTESPSYYIFNLYNENNLIETSGWQIHDSSSDQIINNTKHCIDEYSFFTSLEQNKIYEVKYGVKTVNNLEIYTDFYPYCLVITSDIRDNPFELHADADNENGIIKLYFTQITGPAVTLNEWVQGTIQKTSDKDSFTTWQTVTSFYFDELQDLFDFWQFQDFVVEQGVQYKYRFEIQRFDEYEDVGEMKQYPYFDANYANNGIPISVDFEDMFLYDGEKQIKIKFNPKVSSFKETILESKIDTIGSKYPYFFRNQQVGYKEFPISGLISYYMDNDEMFLAKEQIGLQRELERKQYDFYLTHSEYQSITIEEARELWINDNTSVYEVDDNNEKILINSAHYEWLNTNYNNVSQGSAKFQGYIDRFCEKAFEIFKQWHPENRYQYLQILSSFDDMSPQDKQLLHDDIQQVFDYVNQETYWYLGNESDYNINALFVQTTNFFEFMLLCYPNYNYSNNSFLQFFKDQLYTHAISRQANYYDWKKYVQQLNEWQHSLYKFVPRVISEVLSISSQREGTFTQQIVPANLPTTNLKGYNIRAEREFKMQLLDWLNNGKVKLFRSPTEGNFLIRLMNVSLTPEDRLGRMLHSFQAQAYEVSQLNYKNLLKYNIITKDDKSKQKFTIGIIDITSFIFRYTNQLFIKNKKSKFNQDIGNTKEILVIEKSINLTIEFQHIDTQQPIQDDETNSLLKIYFTDGSIFQSLIGNLIININGDSEYNPINMSEIDVEKIEKIDFSSASNWLGRITYNQLDPRYLGLEQ